MAGSKHKGKGKTPPAKRHIVASGPREANIKLPKGLHRFYLWDKFSDSCFWFMAGLVYHKGMYREDAANAFREFLQLDEESAPTRAIVRKFERQLAQFKSAMCDDRSMIKIFEQENIKDETVFKTNSGGTGRPPGQG